MTPPEDTGTESDERRGAPPLLPDAAGGGGDGHEQRRNAVWLLKWLVVVAAVGVLLDSAFGDRDRLAAANKTPLEFVARVENFDRPDAPTLDFHNGPSAMGWMRGDDPVIGRVAITKHQSAAGFRVKYRHRHCSYVVTR